MDLGQAVVRILLALGVFTYLSVSHLTTASPILGYVVLIVSFSYLLFSLAIAAWNIARPGANHARRTTSLLVDTSVITYALIAGGEITSIVVGGYLWVTIANGLRFGRQYLYITNLASIAGFLLALSLSDYWRENIILGVGLVVWMAILPLYVARLLVRLETALAESEQANVSKSQFIANMSHELRTPLNAVIGYSEMLEEDAQAQGRGQDVIDLQKIQRAASHLLAMINEILDYSKIEAGRIGLNIEYFDAAVLVGEVTNAVGPMLEQNNNRFLLEMAENACFDGYGDINKLRQVLINVLSNACKFTRDGSISLRLSRQAQGDGDCLVFSVTDTGIGMSAEQLQRLFRPFVQADESTTRKYGGTGLGLAISKRYCELMGGSISVSSEINKGSTFTLCLPLRTELAPIKQSPGGEQVDITATAGEPGPRTGPASRAGSPPVMVVDDDPVFRSALRLFLQAHGADVVEAANGLEALEIANSRHLSMIFLDVMMPHMGGPEFLRALKTCPGHKAVPVVAFTGLEAADENDIMDDGWVQDIVHKGDYDLQGLMKQVNVLLRKHLITAAG